MFIFSFPEHLKKCRLKQMNGITISKEIHARNLKDLRNEYVHEFGFESVMNLEENVKRFSKDELATTYARNINFWKSRIPTIDPDNSNAGWNKVHCFHLCFVGPLAGRKRELLRRQL